MIAAIIAGCIFACSSFGSENGADPPEDAGPPVPDRVEPVSDVSSPDGSVGADDPLGVIAYDRHDDFERDPIPGAGPLEWAEEAPGTTVDEVITTGECQDTTHCSPSHAARVQNDATGAGYLATKLSERTRIVRIDFAMRIARANPDVGRLRMASLELTEGRVVFLQVQGNVLQLGDAVSSPDPTTGTIDLGPVAFDTWARYRFYVNLDTRVAAVARDGEAFSSTFTIRPEVVKTMARARLGITLAVENNYEVLYDDVGIRELPQP